MTQPSGRLITVDGASGSGKSTLGRRLARALGLPLIDTGLFYRGVVVAAVRAGVGAGDPAALGRLAAATSIEIETDPGLTATEELTWVDGVPAGEALRDPRHAPLLALVSGLPTVRSAVLKPQRALAGNGAVAVGRDCGTVVFPAAPVKLYLQAPQAVRERRRQNQLRQAGTIVDAGTLRGEVSERDRADSDRPVSPLRPAPDALVIDTGDLSIDEVFSLAMTRCAEAGIGP